MVQCIHLTQKAYAGASYATFSNFVCGLCLNRRNAPPPLPLSHCRPNSLSPPPFLRLRPTLNLPFQLQPCRNRHNPQPHHHFALRCHRQSLPLHPHQTIRPPSPSSPRPACSPATTRKPPSIPPNFGTPANWEVFIPRLRCRFSRHGYLPELLLLDKICCISLKVVIVDRCFFFVLL